MGNEKSGGKTSKKAVAPTRDKEVQEAIRLKAYELYLERGGNDIENWVAAEQIVLKNNRK